MIPENELQFHAVHASGPGGQGVNTSNSAVELRWNASKSALQLGEETQKRLARLCGSRMTQEGVVVIEASEFRSQRQNRSAAAERLEILLAKALVKPKKRRKTRVPKAEKKLRREAKAHRSQRLKDRSVDGE